MSEQTLIVAPCPDGRSVRTPQGEKLQPPGDWILVPPGDPALTRRIKAAGPTWTVQEKKGRKVFSRGVWAPRATVEAIQRTLEMERAAPAHARKREADHRRRERKQADYANDFQSAVLEFLAFAPPYSDLAGKIAQAVAGHATPVGSGTVARTQRIPLPRRAEAAVIAWLRHQTTAYDHMAIPRIRGKRREVRRQLAQESKILLNLYRTGKPIDPAACPLQKAILRLDPAFGE